MKATHDVLSGDPVFSFQRHNVINVMTLGASGIDGRNLFFKSRKQALGLLGLAGQQSGTVGFIVRATLTITGKLGFVSGTAFALVSFNAGKIGFILWATLTTASLNAITIAPDAYIVGRTSFPVQFRVLLAHFTEISGAAASDRLLPVHGGVSLSAAQTIGMPKFIRT
jgi:hypothetical protein